jgi:DNA-binding Lrp family transcriptional regulator
MLMRNSRVPYRILADKLDISLQAVHRRIQVMREIGVIRNFVAVPSREALNAITVFTFGKTEAQQTEDIVETIGADDRVYGIYLAGGNVLYVAALLKDIAELEDITRLMNDVGQVPEPMVGISGSRGTTLSGKGNLSDMDLRIIGALHHDSRMAVTDVAEELGASSRTVNRRLKRMMDEGSIDMTIQWYPCACRDIFAMVHLDLVQGVDKNEVRSTLMRKHGARIVRPMAFSNLPDFLLFLTWSTSPMEVEELQRSIEHEDYIETVLTNILYVGTPFNIWRDRLLEGK